MIKEELAPGIVVYKDVMENYQDFIRDLEDAMKMNYPGLHWKEPMVLRNNQDVVDYTARNLQTFAISYDKSLIDSEDYQDPLDAMDTILSKKFYNAFNKFEEDYKKSYWVETSWHEMYSILKYSSGNFFKDHVDDSQKYHRRVSTVWYANENYTGGEISFTRFNITYKPKANELLVFPSTYTYNHSVAPIIEGERYAVVSWLR